MPRDVFGIEELFDLVEARIPLIGKRDFRWKIRKIGTISWIIMGGDSILLKVLLDLMRGNVQIACSIQIDCQQDSDKP